MHTQHKHNINSHMIALVIQSLVWLYPIQFYLYLSLCLAASSYKWTSCIYSSSYQKCHPRCVWSRDVTHYKPSGFWRTRVKCLSKAEWILANLLSKAEWILANLLSKAEWILANRLSNAEWILANLLSKARWTLAKSFTKPSGFPANFHKPNW